MNRMISYCLNTTQCRMGMITSYFDSDGKGNCSSFPQNQANPLFYVNLGTGEKLPGCQFGDDFGVCDNCARGESGEVQFSMSAENARSFAESILNIGMHASPTWVFTRQVS